MLKTFIYLLLLLLASVALADEKTQTGWQQLVFVAFDVETTGLSPANGDRIIELGAVKFQGTNLVAQCSWLINPGRPIPARSEAVHGITDAMVAAQPAFKDVAPEFASFIDGSILLAHNASFDIRFMRAEYQLAGCSMPANSIYDTLPLYRKWFPDAPSHSLGKLVDYLKLEKGGYHRAAADAHHLTNIFLMGVAQQKPDGLEQLESWQKPRFFAAKPEK